MGYFFNKKRQEIKPSVLPEVPVDKNNKKNKKEKGNMTNEEKIQEIENIILDEKPVKKIKKEKGLIERTESSKTILTEDNKQLLMD